MYHIKVSLNGLHDIAAGLAQLTAEKFMDAMLKVLKDDRQWHTFQLHPLLMLVSILEKKSRCMDAAHSDSYVAGLICPF